MGRKYGKVRQDIWWDREFRRLSVSARVSGFYLMTCGTWGADPVAELANGAGISRRRADMDLRELAEAGFITMRGDNIEFAKLGAYGAMAKPEPTGRLPWYTWSRIRDAVFQRDDHRCRYCGARPDDLECDHVVPVSRGGSNEMSNLVTACQPCNRAKWDKTPEEWRSVPA